MASSGGYYILCKSRSHDNANVTHLNNIVLGFYRRFLFSAPNVSKTAAFMVAGPIEVLVV